MVGLFPQFQDLSGPFFQDLSCVSQGQRGGAVEKGDVKLLFQVGNMVAQGLLGNVEPFGSFCKV